MTSELSHVQKIANGSAWYAKQGWKLLPCHGITDQGRCTCNGAHGEPKDIGKHPAINEWNVKATDDEFIVKTWWENSPEGNIGVFCQPSGFMVIDIDPRSGGIDSFEKFEELLDGVLPSTVEALTGAYTYKGRTVRGRHLYFKCDPSEQLIGNLKANGLSGIDIKHNGYVMLPPSRHGSGVNYEWAEGKAPWQLEIAEAPEFLMSIIRKKTRKSGTSLGNGDWGWASDLEWNGERVDVEKMLLDGIDEGSRAVDIYKLTCALANKLGVQSEVGKMAVETTMIRFNAEKVRPPLELEGPGGLLMHVRRAIDFVSGNPVSNRLWDGAEEWARRSQDEARSTVASSTPAQPSTNKSDSDADMEPSDFNLPGTIGGVVADAAHNGSSIDQAFGSGNIDIPKDPDALSEAEGGRPGRRSLSDIGNGRRIVDSFGSSIRYTPGIGWFIWDGNYWKPDAEDLGMKELAKRIPPIVAAEVANYGDSDNDKKNEVLKWANQAKSNSRLNAAVESANSDTRVVVAVESWDNDAYLLGVANGVIDLRTGELLRGRPDLHITKRSPINYTEGMTNVRWQQFIDFATGGDKELQDWIQRAVGYTLTGLSNQDVMFLVYGPAGSGKNTFVETIVKALDTKQYAWPLDSNILADGNGQSTSTDLYHWAELRGKRMVWVDELPESERLKENAVKKLTGSSEISARSPGEKPFTFQAQAKLWVTTNHRPMITDDAMWRRIRPIPWSNVPENPDPDLKAYLFDPEGALPAVLAWAVEGAIKYLGSSARDPLGWCTAVAEAADMYRKNEDRIGIFLNEETKEVDGASSLVKAIYSVYRVWSEERGERPMTQTAFQRKLQDRGVQIEGQGARAEIKNRVLMPRVVTNDGEGQINWEHAVRIAR
jgi:putative DNA primase/helicase